MSEVVKAWRGSIALPAALLLIAAAAPPPPPGADGAGAAEEIVVTGSRDRAGAIRAYVDALTVETDDQIATFWDQVCPAGFGLPAAYNDVIEARVRDIARRAGIRTARPGCRPNVVIIVADGPFIDRLHRERPDIFRGVALADLRTLLRDPGPIRAWQVVMPRGSDGRPLERVSFLEVRGPPVWIGTAYLRRGLGSSLTQRQTRQDLDTSFILFDLDAVEGLTLTQIADYAAMRTLARTSPAALRGQRTILGLFDDIGSGNVRVEAMTGWDAAYLRALYRTNATVSASRQRSNMARMIEGDAAGPRDEGPPAEAALVEPYP
ncbi:MAG TPA: hypothetical protein VES64_04950 [Allosphingosinicella sp.]|nr:hypothetical protein [Allosphingosinicella sp.]